MVITYVPGLSPEFARSGLRQIKVCQNRAGCRESWSADWLPKAQSGTARVSGNAQAKD